ncbi:MAG: hypothetical protein ACJAQT_000578 [Akkermansiaceae bacterium]|jgi:hypothetical protein
MIGDFSFPENLQIEPPASLLRIDDNGNIRSEINLPQNLKVDQAPQLNAPTSNVVGFTINVDFTGTPAQEVLFTNAANAWMSRITGYRGVMSVSSITITAVIAPIDGPGGTLGSASPIGVSIQDEDGLPGGNEFVLTTTGDMTFDSDDAGALTASVIEHEMGHVLGIGSLWSAANVGLAGPGRQELYTTGSGEFTGANATAAWQAEFGQLDAFVPVELSGGAGTANAHWNENVNGAGSTGITQAGTGNDMRNELMTGWLNDPTFVSNMTLASLNDIGYTTTAILVPEPTSALFAGLGLLLLGGRRRR